MVERLACHTYEETFKKNVLRWSMIIHLIDIVDYHFNRMVTFAPDEIGLADQTSCAGVRADLKICLLNSDCCKKEKKTPRECLKEGKVPDECLQLRQSFFECKRSLLDNRRRFRGLKGY